LNGDPFAEPELPGGIAVAVEPHVLVGAPLCPVVGFDVGVPFGNPGEGGPCGRANAVPAATSKTQLAVVKDAMMFFIVILPV